MTEYKKEGGKTIQTWICPFYACWKYVLDKYSSEEEFPDSRLVKSLENMLELLEVAIKEKTEVCFL